MEFHGSSFLRSATSVQSKVEKSPPHTAKLPPILGASRRMAWRGGVRGRGDVGEGARRMEQGGRPAGGASVRSLAGLPPRSCTTQRPTPAQPTWHTHTQLPPHSAGAARFAHRDAAHKALVGGAVLHALEKVPEAAPHGAHAKCAANVIQDPGGRERRQGRGGRSRTPLPRAPSSVCPPPPPRPRARARNPNPCLPPPIPARARREGCARPPPLGVATPPRKSSPPCAPGHRTHLSGQGSCVQGWGWGSAR